MTRIHFRVPKSLVLDPLDFNIFFLWSAFVDTANYTQYTYFKEIDSILIKLSKSNAMTTI